MSVWNNDDHQTSLDDLDDLAHAPSGSPWMKWLLGWVAPVAIVAYSLVSMNRGSITLPGEHASMTVTGDNASILAAAYIALAAFLHFHFFWSLHPRLWRYAQALKVVALLTFLPCLFIVLYRQFGI